MNFVVKIQFIFYWKYSKYIRNIPNKYELFQTFQKVFKNIQTHGHALKSLVFSDCFNINDYRNCTDARLNGTISENAIYFLGRCLTEEDEDYKKIQNDIGLYYNCSETEVYINSSHCGDIEDFPDFLFDIPNDKRESAASEYLKIEVLNESEGILC